MKFAIVSANGNNQELDIESYRTLFAFNTATYSTSSVLPLGLAALGAYLDREMPEVEILFTCDLDKIISFNPDIVGISATVVFADQINIIIDRVKKFKNIPIILGGPHISNLPQALPKTVDAGVLGEGEITLHELLLLFREKNAFPSESLAKIKGLVYRDEFGNIKLTPPRGVIKDLDSLPFLKIDVAGDPLDFAPGIMSSRGCPYECSFCSLRRAEGIFRYFSPERFVAELEALVSRIYPISTEIRIYDDIFILPPSRFSRIQELIVKKGIHKKVEFCAHIKANNFTDETCKKLMEMNVTRALFGAESASNKILKFYNKRQTAEDCQRAVDICAKHGLKVSVTMIFGAPMETPEDAQLTCDFIERNLDKVMDFGIAPLRVYPGTQLWNYAIQKGYISPNETKYKDDLILTEYFSKDEFLEHLIKVTSLSRKTDVSVSVALSSFITEMQQDFNKHYNDGQI